MLPTPTSRHPVRSSLRPLALACCWLVGAASWVGLAQAAEPLFAPVPPTPPVVQQPAPVQAPGALSEQARQRLSEQAPSARVKAISGRVSNEPAPAPKPPSAAPQTSTARQVAPNHLEPLWGNDALPAGPLPGNKAAPARTAEAPNPTKLTPVAHAPAKADKAASPALAAKHAARRATQAERQASKAPKAAQPSKALSKAHVRDKVGTAKVGGKAPTTARAHADAAPKGKKRLALTSKTKGSAKSATASRKDRAVAQAAHTKTWARTAAKPSGKLVAKTTTAHAHADKAKPGRVKPKSAAPHAPHTPTKRAA